ncbi:MAG: tail fiber domain-containing protein [Salinivirgaceae bacterium]|nr:tail fiber domain-containing protein [Salinivirgaceae bacterium]
MKKISLLLFLSALVLQLEAQSLSIDLNDAICGTYQFSDKRYKKSIKPLKDALENVLKLNGVTYYWRVKDFPDQKFDDQKHIGLIAQDVEKIYPELVITNDKGYKLVSYENLTPILIEAIKELKTEKDNLQKEVEEVKSENDKLNRQIERFRTFNGDIVMQVSRVESGNENLKQQIERFQTDNAILQSNINSINEEREKMRQMVDALQQELETIKIQLENYREQVNNK